MAFTLKATLPANSPPSVLGRVLVVDDELAVQSLVSKVLSGEGYEVVPASNGQEALTLLTARAFDLVLTDLRMPGMDGLTLLNEAKAKGVDSEFIVMTGFGSMESVIEVFREGGVDYLVKPFQTDGLLLAVERAMDRRHLRGQNVSLRKMVALHGVAKAIEASEDLEETLNLIVQTIATELEAVSVGLFLCSPEEGEIKPAAAAGKLPYDPSISDFSRSLLQSSAPALISEAKGRRNGLVLYSKDRKVGALVVDLGAPPNPEQREIFEIMADHAAVAIQKAQLIASLKDSLNRIDEQQEQLIQTSKLSIIGEMAAGIAHEIRNPLSAITLGCELLEAEAEESPAPSPTQAKALETILEASKRLGEVIENLMGFVRKQGPAFGPVDIARTISKTKSLVRYNLTKRHVTLVEDYGDQGKPVWGNEGQLQQVLLNLMLNACDAMTHGGTLTVSTSPAQLESGQPALALALQDTGEGIPPDVLSKIFDPFFTTKGDQGTGLGLTISQTIIKGHGGTLCAKSTLGAGTTFILTLPLASEKENEP